MDSVELIWGILTVVFGAGLSFIYHSITSLESRIRDLEIVINDGLQSRMEKIEKEVCK